MSKAFKIVVLAVIVTFTTFWAFVLTDKSEKREERRDEKREERANNRREERKSDQMQNDDKRESSRMENRVAKMPEINQGQQPSNPRESNRENRR